MSAGYLFLDVDGVLNPTRLNANKLDSTFSKHAIGGFKVWLSKRQGYWLDNLRYRGITIVWATTWVTAPEALATLATRLGLPTDLPRIDDVDQTETVNCGKGKFIDRWLHENGVNPRRVPCVWVDDLLGNRDRMWAWDKGIFPVTVDDRVGLADRRVIKTIEVGLGLDCSCDSEEA
jgi:hypothetical protein